MTFKNMTTFYIPTSTLNFNNILSSESISPKAFYARREFGYKRWTSIENDIENAILLYDKPFSFTRPNSDIEDHPLIIQVNLDEAQVKEYTTGVYYCDHTIYLDPWHTHFIFLSEKDRLTTLSLSDSSLETKLIKLYRNRIIVVEKELSPRQSVIEKREIDLNEKEIERDFTINRIKGLLYGYYIGANMSTGKKYVATISETRELINILSSIQSSEDHTPSAPQAEKLNALLGRIGFFLLKEYIENGLLLSLAEKKLSDEEVISIKANSLLMPSIHEIEINNFHVIGIQAITDNNELSLFKSWTDYLFSFLSNRFNGKITTINTELSDELTKKAKDVYGTRWDRSLTKIFLNDLRRHVRGSGFEENWDNGLLSSLAAVLTHGEDWHNLLLFMQSKGMYDYRLAYAFYGVLNGFANLTRDFTDNLYNTSSEYIASVYKEVYRQLFGIDLATSVENNRLTYRRDGGTDEDNSKEEAQAPLPPVNNLIKKVKGICHSLKLSKSQKENLNKAILENGDNESPISFITLLKGFSGWKKGEKLNAIRNGLYIGEGKKDNNKRNPQPSNQLDLFPNSVHSDIQEKSKVTTLPDSFEVSAKNTAKRESLFIDDYAIWFNLLTTYAPPSTMKKLKDDCDWFVSEYQKSDASKYYAHASHDNNKTILAFKRYIEKKHYSSKINIDGLISKLMEMYV